MFLKHMKTHGNDNDKPQNQSNSQPETRYVAEDYPGFQIHQQYSIP